MHHTLALLLPHHVTVAGMVFRHFRHGDYSLAALKQLYAEKGLIESEHDTVPIIQLTSVDELMDRVHGTHIVCEGPVDIETVSPEQDAPPLV